MSDHIRVRRRFDGQSISGKVAFTAPSGLIVKHSVTAAEPTLIKCTGKRGFMLVRDVVTQAVLEAQLITNAAFPNSEPILPPDLVGSHCSASKVLEAEVEGAGLLMDSGTGLLSGSTAIDTELSTKQGRLYARQSGDELCGWLREQLTPIDSGNAFRIRVEYVA